MRAATFAASLVAVGLFLAMASTLAFTPTWIGLGVMAISVIGASAMVLADRPEMESIGHG